MSYKGSIPDTFIRTLIASTDIVTIISRHISLIKSGRSYKGCCPFHNEKTPSFYVSPDKQMFYCFGCKASGDVITFIRDYERIDFSEAIEILAHQQGSEVPYEGSSSGKSNAQFKKPHDSKSQKQKSALKYANKFFRWQLKHFSNTSQNTFKESSPNQYLLEKRKLSEKTIVKFSIGYAPSNWDTLYKTLKTSFTDETLRTSGLIAYKQNHYDYFRDRIIFPIRNRIGHIIGFGGRVLSADKQPKYLNSPESDLFKKSQEIYGLYEIRQLKTRPPYLLITEGYMDVISLSEHGFLYAVATLGTALTLEHLKRLLRESKHLVFCYDGDKAGQMAALRSIELILPLLDESHTIQYLTLPEKEDPDSWIQKHGLNQFITEINTALGIIDYLFQRIFTNQSSTLNSDEQAKAGEHLKRLIKTMSENTYSQIIRQKFSQLSGLSPQQTQVLLKTNLNSEITTNPNPNPNPKHNTTFKLTATNPAAIQLLKLCLYYPNILKTLEIPEAFNQVNTSVERLCIQLKKIIQPIPDHVSTAMLFREVESQFEQTPNLWRQLHQFSIQNPILISESVAQSECISLTQQYLQQLDLKMIQTLISKSRNTEMTPEERQILTTLLHRTKIKPHTV